MAARPEPDVANFPQLPIVARRGRAEPVRSGREPVGGESPKGDQGAGGLPLVCLEPVSTLPTPEVSPGGRGAAVATPPGARMPRSPDGPPTAVPPDKGAARLGRGPVPLHGGNPSAPCPFR